MFIAALFTIAKTRKQPTCPSTGEQIQIWHIRAREYHSAAKYKRMPFEATWKQLEIIILSEVS